MNRKQIANLLFLTVLFSPVSTSVWGQTEEAGKVSGGQFVPAYPPGPYGWRPAYPQPVPWGAAPGWMPPPPAYRQPPGSAMGYTQRTAQPQARVEAITSERDQLKAQLDKKQSELTSTHEQLDQARDSLQQAQESIKAAEKDKLENTQEQARLTDKLAEVTTVYDTSKAKFETLNTQIETLQQAVNEQQAELEKFQSSAAEQQAEIERLLSQVAKRDEKLTALEADLDTATQALAAAEAEAMASTDKLGALEAEQQSCTDQLASLTDRLKQATENNQSTSQEIADASATAENLTAELSACNMQLASYKEELTASRTETAKPVEHFEPEATEIQANSAGANTVNTADMPVNPETASMINEDTGMEVTAAGSDTGNIDIEKDSQQITEDQQGVEAQVVEKSEEPAQPAANENTQALTAITPQENSETITVIPANITMPDFDKDGINDSVDLCLDSKPGTKVDMLGCNRGQPIVMSGVTFPYDSHELSGEARSILDNIASILDHYPDLKFEIAGYTDAQGDAAYNQWLSKLRAQAVREYLIEKGLPENNLTAHGYGAEHPIATNDTRDGLRVNRRVELRRLE